MGWINWVRFLFTFDSILVIYRLLLNLFRHFYFSVLWFEYNCMLIFDLAGLFSFGDQRRSMKSRSLKMKGRLFSVERLRRSPKGNLEMKVTMILMTIYSTQNIRMLSPRNLIWNQFQNLNQNHSSASWLAFWIEPSNFGEGQKRRSNLC